MLHIQVVKVRKMDKYSIIYDSLSKSSLFKGNEDAFLSKVADQAVLLKLEKGKLLFVHEDKAERFYIIQNGWVKLFRETIDGEQAIIDIATVGDLFGDTALFHDNIYPYSAEVIEPSNIISLPLSFLKSELDNNPQVSKNFLLSLAQAKSKQDKEIEHRAIQNAPQRIACFLLKITPQHNNEDAMIKLPYDKMFIAARLGMKAETFSRALKKLKSDTGIHIKGSMIEIDNVQQLSNYACKACSFKFPCSDV